MVTMDRYTSNVTGHLHLCWLTRGKQVNKYKRNNDGSIILNWNNASDYRKKHYLPHTELLTNYRQGK